MLDDGDEQQESFYCTCDVCVVDDNQLKKNLEDLPKNELKINSSKQNFMVDLIGDKVAAWCFSWRHHREQQQQQFDLPKDATEAEEAVQTKVINSTTLVEDDHHNKLKTEEKEKNAHLIQTTSPLSALFSPADLGSDADVWYSNISSWRQLRTSADVEEVEKKSSADDEETPPFPEDISRSEQLFITTIEEEEEPKLSTRGQLVAQDLAALRQLLSTKWAALTRQLEVDIAAFQSLVLSPLVEDVDVKTSSLMTTFEASLWETGIAWQAGGRQMKKSVDEGAQTILARFDKAQTAVATSFSRSGTLVRAIEKLATEVVKMARQTVAIVTEIEADLQEASSNSSASASLEFSFSSSGTHHQLKHQHQQPLPKHHQQQNFTTADLYEANRSGPLRLLVAWVVTKFGPTEQSSSDGGSLAEWPHSSGLSEGGDQSGQSI